MVYTNVKHQHQFHFNFTTKTKNLIRTPFATPETSNHLAQIFNRNGAIPHAFLFQRAATEGKIFPHRMPSALDTDGIIARSHHFPSLLLAS